jgi:hypothetical protein
LPRTARFLRRLKTSCRYLANGRAAFCVFCLGFALVGCPARGVRRVLIRHARDTRNETSTCAVRRTWRRSRDETDTPCSSPPRSRARSSSPPPPP